jgi:hypothetical protein
VSSLAIDDSPSHTNPIRQDRIHNEAIVDAYGPEEKTMGWYYYLENRIRFPFQARCIATKLVSPPVEVRRLAPEDACSDDMLVLIRWQGHEARASIEFLERVYNEK